MIYCWSFSWAPELVKLAPGTLAAEVGSGVGSLYSFLYCELENKKTGITENIRFLTLQYIFGYQLQTEISAVKLQVQFK